MRRQVDNSLLEMALIGYNAKLNEIVEKMTEIKRALAGEPAAAPAAGTPAKVAGPKGKRKLSAAGKQAIRAALQKRWAAYHAKTSSAKPAAKTAKKRTLSPAAKARLAANLAKARAAKANKRAAGAA